MIDLRKFDVSPVLHINRNPHGKTQEERNKMRLSACDVIEAQQAEIKRLQDIIAWQESLIKIYVNGEK